ncbi:hypothetical protein GCM10009624_30190 [Gordonia sinesedis]
MTSDSQVVVYRSCMSGGPEWQFYSMPESIVGGAHDLEDARQQYRDALAFSLDVETSDLPVLRELVEYEADKGTGLWIRGGLDSPTFDGAVDVLTNYVASQTAEDVRWFFAQPAASGDAIIVPVEPTDTLGSVTSQMTPFDSVWIVSRGKHPDGSDMLVWLALEGNSADSGGEVEPTNLTDLGLTPESPISDVYRLVIKSNTQTGEEQTPGDALREDHAVSDRRYTLIAV